MNSISVKPRRFMFGRTFITVLKDSLNDLASPMPRGFKLDWPAFQLANRARLARFGVRPTQRALVCAALTVNAPHARRFARSGDARHSRSVARGFSTAFPPSSN